ncbi:AraC family transcriptional regulator [Rhodococcus sp. T2V]|uniref:helix-turn-helix transcriptional regulator n=1 Tax=Rhodococcus sp. T2V TaxID=3034164 RepID=UPI0023E1F171|nr:AraC family transcriptional regulator [Rhodococcus sp. T2V]MDF3310489.1 AraC family transcriptional regulator [Rhodococcus sp. T2V]
MDSVTQTMPMEELLVELNCWADGAGAREVRPGLTVCRFDAPGPYLWEPAQGITFGLVAQGRLAVEVDRTTHRCDPLQGVVFTDRLCPAVEVLAASADSPFLALFLQIDSAIIRRISTDVLVSDASAAPITPRGRISDNQCSGTFAVGVRLLHSVLRLLRALDGELDERVLAPICLQEIVYRLLQIGCCRDPLEVASRESDTDPSRAAIAYIRSHLTESITVSDIAREVQLSESAFAHTFRTTIGVSPYQFLKSERLDAARRILLTGSGLKVSEVARAVGYSSSSHFITEFKRRYAVTPREYANGGYSCTALEVVDRHDGAAAARTAEILHFPAGN